MPIALRFAADVTPAERVQAFDDLRDRAVPRLMQPGVLLEITEAVSILQGLGLKVGFVKHPTILSLGKVKVEQQNPAPNSLVHDDAQVMLTMSAPSLDFGALLGLVAKEPAYQNLKPEYKNVLDAFMGNPNVTRGMDPSTPTD